MKIRNLIIIFFAFAFISANAQENTDWQIKGQLQLRSEADGRDFSNKTYMQTFTSMRSRLAVEKWVSNKTGFFLQIQDSRVFGFEPTTLSGMKNIDLHQGYVVLNKLFEIPVNIQAGRFEIAYGTERFIGSVGWNYVGRSFDGIRFSFISGFNADFFALSTFNTVSYKSGATPGNYPYPATPDASSSIYGFWTSNKINEQNSLDVFGYYDVNRIKTVDDNPYKSVFTLGVSHFGNFGSLSTVVEAAYQLGKLFGRDVSAYLVTAKGTYSTGKAKLSAGIDILSGTKQGEKTKYNSFSNDYGSNHGIYGYMDYFGVMPVSTGNLGLNDYYLTLTLLPFKDWNIGINAHHFTTNQFYNDLNALGQEVDLTVKYDFIKGTALTFGTSVFLPGDLMKEIFKTPAGPREDASLWSYIMITANI